MQETLRAEAHPNTAEQPTAYHGSMRDQRSQRSCLRFAMSVAEEIFALNPPDEPSNMHSELRVSGSFDDERLRRAIASAVSTHPMSQVRLLARRFLLRPPQWEIGDVHDGDTLRVVDCADEQQLGAIRDAFYSQHVDLRKAPALRALLVHRPGGDTLLFKIPHSTMDGIGAMRWIYSVVRAYTGRPDPIPAIDPLLARNLRGQFGSTDSRPSVTDSRTESIGSVAPVAGNRTSDKPGYGVRNMVLSAERCAQLDPCRHGVAATLNDLLLAALHLTIASWNAGHDQPSGLISIVVPVNLRPIAWNNEVVANLAWRDRILSTPRDRASPESLMAAVTAQTWQIRAGASASFATYLTRPRWACWLVDNLLLPLILYCPSVVPNRIKGPVDTIVFANLGRVTRTISDFGDAGRLTEAWGSPPAAMPMGIAFGALTLNGRVHLSLRFRRALFDDAAAEDFGAMFLETLLNLGTPSPATRRRGDAAPPRRHR